MFYIAGKKGFLTDDGDCDANVRWARPFKSFDEADEWAKHNPKAIGVYYVILSTAITEAA